ncbi:MAG TPA: hypothetical protein VEI02_04095 [Planctomycetota bacterium]|nr:hypothetical protein [Planctomycetota bacterium]
MAAHRFRRIGFRAATLLTLAPCIACHTGEYVATGAVLGTVALGRTPSHDLEQIYYLGVFDPMEQVPPTLYRVIVRGQASAMSNVKYASGWVPSAVVDTLQTRMFFDPQTGDLQIKGGQAGDVGIKPDRRMFMFGPEGFREAPMDHRLVIVMGADPSAYFEAVDSVLGGLATERAESRAASKANNALVFDRMRSIVRQQERVEGLKRELRIAKGD